LQCLTRTRVERNFRLRTAIGQEPYLGFNALGDIYLAGQAPPAVGPGVTDAAREWSQVDKTSIAELETFVRRHKTSPEADYARARIEGLKQAAATGSRKPTEQPIVSPRPDAGSLGQSIACVNAKFQDDCERAGCTWFLRSCMTPANAIAAKLAMEKTPTAATKCDGVRAQVGNDKRCLKPKDSFRDCHRGARRRRSGGAPRSRRSRPTTTVMPTRTRAAAPRANIVVAQRQSIALSPTRGASTMSMATSGSGRRTAGTQVTPATRATVAREWGGLQGAGCSRRFLEH
jgi:hypothetical protein